MSIHMSDISKITPENLSIQELDSYFSEIINQIDSYPEEEISEAVNDYYRLFSASFDKYLKTSEALYPARLNGEAKAKYEFVLISFGRLLFLPLKRERERDGNVNLVTIIHDDARQHIMEEIEVVKTSLDKREYDRIYLSGNEEDLGLNADIDKQSSPDTEEQSILKTLPYLLSSRDFKHNAVIYDGRHPHLLFGMLTALHEINLKGIFILDLNTPDLNPNTSIISFPIMTYCVEDSSWVKFKESGVILFVTRKPDQQIAWLLDQAPGEIFAFQKDEINFANSKNIREPDSNSEKRRLGSFLRYLKRTNH